MLGLKKSLGVCTYCVLVCIKRFGPKAFWALGNFNISIYQVFLLLEIKHEVIPTASHPCVCCFFLLYELLGVVLPIRKTLLQKVGLLILWRTAPVFTSMLSRNKSKSKVASNRGKQPGFCHQIDLCAPHTSKREGEQRPNPIACG